MMRVALAIILVMILLGAMQGSLAGKMAFAEIRPDFLVVGTVVIGLLLGPVVGTFAGMLAGLVHASVVGLGFGSFVLSRTLVGFLAGSAKPRVFHDNPAVPLVGGVVGTLVAEFIFTLFNPPARLAAWIAPLPLIALYNGLLALPASWALRRLLAAKPSPPA